MFDPDLQHVFHIVALESEETLFNIYGRLVEKEEGTGQYIF
jgi:hypothetical protein